VVDRGDRPVGLAYAAPGCTEAVERLWRSDLVDQMQVYIKKRQAVWRRGNYVLVPYFFEEGAFIGHSLKRYFIN
jgi:hypothetical protein